jgi:hypothetical protein
MGRSYRASQIIADLGVVCAGDWPPNFGFCRDDPSLDDVARKIDGLSTYHWAMEMLRNNAFEVDHQCFAKNMVVDTWGTGCSVN